MTINAYMVFEGNCEEASAFNEPSVCGAVKVSLGENTLERLLRRSGR